jgi:hypothetical protein
MGVINMDWMDILKNNQINVGSTTLDTRELPEEDDDKTCNEILERAINHVKNVANTLETKLQGIVDDINENNPPYYTKKTQRNRDGQTHQLKMEIGKSDEDWYGDSTVFRFNVPGSWSFELRLRHNYQSIPEEHACMLLEQFNNRSGPENLNDVSDSKLNRETSTWKDNPVDGIMMRTNRYDGDVGSWAYPTKTKLSYNIRSQPPLHAELELLLVFVKNHPHSWESYDNRSEHMTYIQKEIDIKGLHEEIRNLLRY